jgi:2-polyprenyl-3-methyl-5-hydroxy-6-metoxy-1,4-benzoquinol methylase
MRRILTPERLDDPGQPADRVVHSLGQVSQANRWLGGDRSLRAALRDLNTDAGGLDLLDVGVGDGSTFRRTLGWLARRGIRARGVGVDLNPLACRAGRSADPGSGFVAAHATALPFGDDCFDVALATLTLHHFPQSRALAVLRQMVRVARSRVVVSELGRSLPHYVGAHILSHTVWGNNSITRHDAPASVRSGFTGAELGALGEEAGLTGIRILRHFPFRVTLSGTPT